MTEAELVEKLRKKLRPFILQETFDGEGRELSLQELLEADALPLIRQAIAEARLEEARYWRNEMNRVLQGWLEEQVDMSEADKSAVLEAFGPESHSRRVAALEAALRQAGKEEGR